MVDQLAATGVREVTLIGGEAYLRDDWCEVVAALSERGLRVTLTTGARQLTAARVTAARRAGLDAVSVSIDGLEDTHDALRGVKGSWRAAVESCERVQEAGISLGVNTQINRLSLAELPALAALVAELGATGWQVQLTVPMGRAADRPQLLLQPHDLLDLFPLLLWTKTTRLDPAGVTLFLGNNLGYHGPYERLLRYGADRWGAWSGCGAGSLTIGIEADGTLKGCPSLPTATWAGGQLPTDDLRALLQRPAMRRLRERTREDLHGFCATCIHGDTCLAGCSWTSDVYFGRTGDNPFCIHRALLKEAEGLRERVVLEAPAPGRPFDHGRFRLVEEALAATRDDHSEPSVEGVALTDLLALHHARDRSAIAPAQRNQGLAKHPLSR